MQMEIERTRESWEMQQQRMIAEKMESISHLATMVAHELRNPLGVIKMALYNIQHSATDPVQQRHFEVIDRKINESEKILEALVDYAQFTPVKLQPTSLLPILETCATAAETKFRDLPIRLVRQFSQLEDQIIPADHTQLTRLLEHLLDNAYQAMDGHHGEVRFSGQRIADRMVIMVADNGMGIHPVDLPQIFKPFWTKKSKALGLGLCVAHQIAELHSGTLTVESRKDQGSTFTLSLPAV